MLQAPSFVEVSFLSFCNILKDVAPRNQIDTGSMLVTAGAHPELGDVLMIDNPMGGRIVAVDQSKLSQVQHYTKQ